MKLKLGGDRTKFSESNTAPCWLEIEHRHIHIF